ncbi:death-associated protein kinase related [Anopheles aquasalis]|uniref:death-associated protein kinase related n=1 Tax=Anopheles aquasalis TaxID=42839 RepID=UPI00215A1B16|nr:death-associated protein kinase related [Anopheles aquasalis]XP_050099976.1 death-associated protein kinase related [Anopheles aquasalis]XP_050099984.1 death-associated protein kinase related [Anopheles aquasalis]XP_050099992.1 death-associated protein kinase related [Anopheles aquasalis]
MQLAAAKPSLRDGFSHVGEGWLDVSEAQLQQLKVPSDIADSYDIEESWFAKGKYGILRRAVCKKSGVEYAAKFLRRRRRGQCCQKEINHEIAVLMLCSSSQHIVRLHAVHDTRLETALILELASGGELQTLIDEKGMLSEAKTRICMRDILRAVQHMHRHSIAHLDLKPQNILLTGTDVEDGLKLCDFGIARLMDDTHTIHDIIGTPDYVAPEVLHYEPLTLQTDIWSIGVLAYVLLTGYTPFGGETKQETFLNITKCSLTFPEDMFEGVSSEAIDFIRRALRIRPRERMTVDECLAHPWMVESVAPNTRQSHLTVHIHCAVASEVDPSQAIEQLTVDTALSAMSTRPETVTPEQGSLTVEVTTATGAIAADDQRQEQEQEQNEKQLSSSEMNGCSITDARQTEALLLAVAQQEANEDNKENLTHNAAAAACIGAIAGNTGVIATTVNSNGANPAIVSRALFPDAPTTPKVSRKASPTDEQQKQQQQQQQQKPNGIGVSQHHHHHHLHHPQQQQQQQQQQLHTYHNGHAHHQGIGRASYAYTNGSCNSCSIAVGIVGGGGEGGGCEIAPMLSRTSGGLAGSPVALSAPLNVRAPHSVTAASTTTASVKVFVQKYQSLLPQPQSQQQQQQHPSDEVVAGQEGDCPSVGSTATAPGSAVCITTTTTTTATVLVAATSAAASLPITADIGEEQQADGGGGGGDGGGSTDGSLCGHGCSDSSTAVVAHHPHHHLHHPHHPHHNHHHPHHHHHHHHSHHHHHHQPLQPRDPDTIIC